MAPDFAIYCIFSRILMLVEWWILACLAGDRGSISQHSYHDNFTMLFESYFGIWILLSRDPQPSHVVFWLWSGDFTAIANMAWPHRLLIFHAVSSANMWNFFACNLKSCTIMDYCCKLLIANFLGSGLHNALNLCANKQSGGFLNWRLSARFPTEDI